VLKAKRMTRVHLSGPKSELTRTVAVLHKAKVLHIVDYAEGLDGFSIGSPDARASDYSHSLVDLRSMLLFLKASSGNAEVISRVAAVDVGAAAPTSGSQHPGEAAWQRFAPLSAEFHSLLGERDSLEEKLEAIASARESFGPLSALGLSADDYQGYGSVRVFRGLVRRRFEPELRKITASYALYEGDYNNNHVIALFVENSKASQAEQLLRSCGYAELPLPEKVVDLKGTAMQESDARKRIAEIDARFAAMKAEHGAFLRGYEQYLRCKNEKAEAPLRFATSDHAFVADGWMPTASLRTVTSELDKATSGKTGIELLEGTEGAPVALDNPKSVQPFEFFMDLYSMPRYLEIDPTAVMFLTFPLFFGFMLGDVGYGLVSLAAFLFLSMRFKGEGKALANALILASLASVLFGFVFAEFFGVTFMEHPLLERAHDFETMIIVSMAVGFIHINLGYALGFMNVLKEHGFAAAVFEKGSWVVIEAGVIALGAQYLGYAPAEAMYAGAGLVLLGIAMLFKGEGIIGIAEIPSLLSNILSYARLFAVGLASVSLALVVNKFATNFMHQGGLYIILAIVVLFLGHALNLMLGILGPFLHSLRLHYVEFFTKFYKGGGVKYAPFGAEA